MAKSRVSNLEIGGYTDMQFRYIAYDLGMPAEVFTERSLRTPPKRVAAARQRMTSRMRHARTAAPDRAAATAQSAAEAAGAPDGRGGEEWDDRAR